MTDDIITTPATDTPADLDPVNFLLGKVNEDHTTKCLDGEDQPCIRLVKDPTRRLYRLYDRDGKVSLRVRSYLRNLYHYHRDTLHLANAELALAVEYIAEDAYQGGRERTLAVTKKDGDLIGDSFSSRWRQLLLRFDHPPIGTRQDVVSVAVFARRFLACSAR